MQDAYDAILEHYKEQFDSYTLEEIRSLHETILEMCSNKNVPKRYREAAAYFCIKLHVIEYARCTSFPTRPH